MLDQVYWIVGSDRKQSLAVNFEVCSSDSRSSVMQNTNVVMNKQESISRVQGQQRASKAGLDGQ